MICRYCKNEIPDDAKFCDRCGKKVEAGPLTAEKAGPARNPGKSWVIVVVVVCVILLGGIGITLGLVLSDKPERKDDRYADSGDKETTAAPTTEAAVQEEPAPVQPEAAGGLWGAAYCNFLAAVFNEDIDVLDRDYPETKNELTQFYDMNYNAYAEENGETKRLPASSGYTFSLIDLEKDGVPELLLSGDYAGQIFRYSENRIVPFAVGEYLDYRNGTGLFGMISLQSYPEITEQDLQGKYKITIKNLVENTACEEARALVFKDPSQEEEGVMDIGEKWLEVWKFWKDEQNWQPIEEVEKFLVDECGVVMDPTIEEGVLGLYQGVEVYEQMSDTAITYENVKLDKVRLFGIYPGMPEWKARYLLETAGYYRYDSYDSEGGLYTAYHQGEEFGDQIAGITVKDGRVVEVTCAING